MAVLVVYATVFDSTREIALRIAAELKQAGIRVDAVPVVQVSDIRAYKAVVVGSAIRDNAWLPEAADFVRRHYAALAGRPVWLFSVGVLGDERAARVGPFAWRFRYRPEQRPAELPEFRRILRLRDHHAFMGALQPGPLGWLRALLFRLRGGRFGDSRNWSEVDDWARRIATDLGGGAPATSLDAGSTR